MREKILILFTLQVSLIFSFFFVFFLFFFHLNFRMAKESGNVSGGEGEAELLETVPLDVRTLTAQNEALKATLSSMRKRNAQVGYGREKKGK